MRRKGKRKIIAIYFDNLETLKIISLGSFLSLATKIVVLVLPRSVVWIRSLSAG